MAEPTVAPSAPSPAPPPAPAPAAPPAQGGERITDAHYDNLPADQQSRYARVRASSDGGSVWQARRDLGSDGRPAPAPVTTPAPSGSDAQARFVDNKLILGDHELSGDDVKMLFAEKAARDLRATQVPKGPEGYAPTLPANLKLPDGVAVAIDAKDPAFADLTRVAHRAGLSQADFSDLIGIYAAKQATETAQLASGDQSRNCEARP